MLGHECRHAWLVPDSMRFPGERGVERTPAMRMPERRFPPSWSVEETDACFIVRDHGGCALKTFLRPPDLQTDCGHRTYRCPIYCVLPSTAAAGTLVAVTYR